MSFEWRIQQKAKERGEVWPDKPARPGFREKPKPPKAEEKPNAITETKKQDDWYHTYAFSSPFYNTFYDELYRKPSEALSRKLESLKVTEARKVKEPLRVPDYVECLVGWRGWRVSNGKLEALGVSGVWEPKKAEPSVCTAHSVALFGNSPTHNDTCPSTSCTCGYWSFDSLEKLSEALKRYESSVKVIGQVYVWGKVIQCENGFRSEFAYPKELWLLEEGLEDLGWKYGIPIRTLPKTSKD